MLPTLARDHESALAGAALSLGLSAYTKEPVREVCPCWKMDMQAALPKGNALMMLRDEIGPFFEDEGFSELYPALGQPAESPGCLTLVTILQFMEQLTDR